MITGDTGATFSECRRYRTLLWRIWDERKPFVNFCLMNPSTADEVENDPTIERRCRHVMKWNERIIQWGGVVITNAFSIRETDSKKVVAMMRQGLSLVDPVNDEHILWAAKNAGLVVCGWGQPAKVRGREILKLFHANGIQPYALKLSKDGTPVHPLYLSYDLDPIAI